MVYCYCLSMFSQYREVVTDKTRAQLWPSWRGFTHHNVIPHGSSNEPPIQGCWKQYGVVIISILIDFTFFSPVQCLMVWKNSMASLTNVVSIRFKQEHHSLHITGSTGRHDFQQHMNISELPYDWQMLDCMTISQWTRTDLTLNVLRVHQDKKTTIFLLTGLT